MTIDALLDGMAAQSAELGRMFALYCHARVPELDAREEILAATQASSRANFVTMLALMRNRSRVQEYALPEPILEWPRVLARAGIGVEPALRAYRVCSEALWALWTKEIAAGVGDPAHRDAAMQFCMRYAFDYVDYVSERVAGEHATEAARLRHNGQAVRAATVRALLDGEPLDVDRAGARLGYDLRRWHVGLIAWRDGDHVTDADLTEALGAAATALGGGAPLYAPAGTGTLWGWTGRHEPFAAGAGVPSPPAGVAVAIGDHAHGPDGFAVTHRLASAARRVAHPPPSVTRHRDVAALILLTADREAATAFVRRELGTLAGPSKEAAELRETLAAYLAAGRWRAAARNLGIHENTVINRVRRIEELLGHPVAERRFELEAAVRLARALGRSRVEGQAPQVSDAIASILLGANRASRALSSA